MLWEDQARSVVDGYFGFFRESSWTDANKDQANLIMAAMIGLAHQPGCPGRFKDLAGNLILDGVLGEMFEQVFLSLRELINE